MISKIIATNRRAKFEFEIIETVEAGLVLKGSEIKSCRLHNVSIKEAYVGPMEGEIYLFNSNIPEYDKALKHEPKAPRKLLLHKKQMNKWIGRVKEKGLSIIPLQMYFNEKGMAKIEIALARGKKLHDKRETIKERDIMREENRTKKNG